MKMASSSNGYVVSETMEILIDLGPMKNTIHQVSSQPGSSLLTSMYAQKISPKIINVCFICDKMFINHVSLAKHLLKHNIVLKDTASSASQAENKKINEDPAKITPPGALQCEYCQEWLDNEEELVKHEQFYHYLFDGSIMEKHCCGYCGVKFSRRRDLFHHIRCCGTLSAVDSCKLATEINMRINNNKQWDESSLPSTRVKYFCLNCKQKRSFKILSLDCASKLLKLNCQACGKLLHLTYFTSELAKAKEPQKAVDCDATTEPCQDNVGTLTSTPQSTLIIDDDDDDPVDDDPVANDDPVADDDPGDT